MAWLTGFDKRIKITIDSAQVDSNLSNFPVPIYLSASSGPENDDVSAIFDELITVSGTKKIAITTSDEQTQCYVEIERWDWSNEKAWLHVKVPTIVSGTDTELYFYYDSTHADNTTYVGDVGSTPGQTVWDSNFKLVCHMGEDPTGGSGCIKDSTSNTNHGTPGGSMTSGDLVDGKFGKALDFDGSDDEVNVGAVANFTGNCTISLLVKKDGVDNGFFIVKRGPGGNQFQFWMYHDAFSQAIFFWNGTTSVESVGVISSNVWRHAAVTRSGTDITFYINGSGETSQTLSVPGSSTEDIILSSDGTAYANGALDEVRISDIARSSAWIKATYEGLWDNLLTFGTQELEPAFYYEGYITVESVSASRVVNLYKRDTGELIDSTTSSDSSGYFKLGSQYDDYHFVVALPDLTENYAILTDDKIHPTGGN